MDKIQNSPSTWVIGSAAIGVFGVYALTKQNNYVKELKYILSHPSQPSNTNRKSIYDFIKLGIEYGDCPGMGNGGYKLLKWHALLVVSLVGIVGCLLRAAYLKYAIK